MEENDTEVFAPKSSGKEPDFNLNSLLLLLILLTMVAFGAFYFGKSKKEVVSPTPTALVETTATSSPEATTSASPIQTPTATPEDTTTEETK